MYRKKKILTNSVYPNKCISGGKRGTVEIVDEKSVILCEQIKFQQIYAMFNKVMTGSGTVYRVFE